MTIFKNLFRFRLNFPNKTVVFVNTMYIFRVFLQINFFLKVLIFRQKSILLFRTAQEAKKQMTNTYVFQFNI